MRWPWESEPMINTQVQEAPNHLWNTWVEVGERHVKESSTLGTYTSEYKQKMQTRACTVCGFQQVVPISNLPGANNAWKCYR